MVSLDTASKYAKAVGRYQGLYRSVWYGFEMK